MRNRVPKRTDQSAPSIRQRAEAMVSASPTDVTEMATTDIKHLFFELQVHQIELELQNEQLRETNLELSLSHDRYADLYDFAPVGYVTIDSSGFIIEANFATATLLGVGRDHLLGSKISDFFAPTSQDDAYLYLQKIFSTAEKHITELEIRRQDGGFVTVRLESAAFDSSFPPKLECRIALIDTTDLMSLRKSLAALNAELKHRVEEQVQEIRLMANALAQLDEGVLITNGARVWASSQVVFANDALCKYLCLTHEEISAQTPEGLVKNLFGVSEFESITGQIVATGGFRGTLECINPDGRDGEIELSISPLESADHQTLHFVAVLRDTTLRKRDELKLNERKERLQAIHNAVLDSIVTIDQHGIIQNCNAALEQVFGYTSAELLGQNVSKLMPEPHSHQHDGYLRRYLETGEAHIIGKSRELRALHRDGHTFPITLSISAVDHLGLFTGVICDISSLQELRREVLHAAVKVQWSIGQALHDGPQQALAGLSLLARGLALDLERHDSPLAAEAKVLSERLKEENKTIRLLGKGLIPVQVDSSGLTSALQNLASQVSEESDLDCQFECPEPVDIKDLFIMDQLYHIAQEAVLNAVKHSGADCVVIYLGSQGSNVLLRVEDNGSGISNAKSKTRGLGLRIMPYRASTIGASLTISNAVGGGAMVECKLDLSAISN